MRRVMMVVGPLAAVLLVSACGGAGGKATKLLPEDTEMIVGIDVAGAMKSGVWELGSGLMDDMAKEDGMKDAVKDNEKKLKEFTKTAGFDPMTDIKMITIGVGPMDKGQPDFVAVIEGANFDAEKLKDYAEEEMGAKLEEDEVGKITIYTDEGKGGFFVVGDSMLVVASEDWLEEAANLSNGEGKSVSENKELMAALKKVDGKATFYFAGVASDAIEDSLKGAPVEGLDDAVNVAVSVILSDGIKLVANVGFDDEGSAEDVKDSVEGLAKMGKKMAKEGMDDMPCGKKLKPLMDLPEFENKGMDMIVTVDVDGDTTADIFECAGKEGPGMMGMFF